MKSIPTSLVVLATLGGLTTLSLADKPKPAKAPKQNFGESFGLKQRRVAPPRGNAEPIAVRSLSDGQVGRVIKDRVGDLEYCWLRVPVARRTATATLHVSIEAAGTVSETRIDGELPASVGKCITTAANRWTFPVAESRTEIEHGITLSTK